MPETPRPSNKLGEYWIDLLKDRRDLDDQEKKAKIAKNASEVAKRARSALRRLNDDLVGAVVPDIWKDPDLKFPEKVAGLVAAIEIIPLESLPREDQQLFQEIK